MERKRAVVLMSGGPDSSTAAYWARNEGLDIRGIFFDYGHLHADYERAGSRAIAAELGIHLEIVDVQGLRNMLIGFVPPPYVVISGTGRWPPSCGDPESLLGIATTYATLIKARTVIVGSLADDLEGFPSLREFYEHFEGAIRVMPRFDGDFELLRPFIEMRKPELIRLGADLGVPFELTRSCQETTTVNCGQCNHCQVRKSAFSEAGVTDPTTYAE
jgi:7-cyano-7-deazaguanine synthase